MEQPYCTDDTVITEKDKVNWGKVAIVSAMISFSIPTFMTGIELFSILSWRDGLIALFIGASLLTAIGGLMGDIGAFTGKNSYMLVKQTFGEKGAMALNFLFAFSLVGWFGVNLDLFSESVLKVLDLPQNHVSHSYTAIVIELLVGAGMIVTTMVGFNIINKLSIALTPIMICCTMWMLWQSFDVGMSFDSMVNHTYSQQYSISEGVNMIVGVIIVGAIILPDITRFSKQRQGGLYTAFWAYFITQSIVIIIAAIAAKAFEMHDILDIILALGFGNFSLVVVIAGCWVLNSLNLYSAELAIKVNTPALNSYWITIVLGLLGTVSAFVNILDYFITFLSILTALFIPVAGIIALDIYHFTQADDIDRSSDRSTDKHPIFAMLAWAVGAIISIFSLVAPLPSLTSISAIDAILVSSLTYWLLIKIAKQRVQIGA